MAVKVSTGRIGDSIKRNLKTKEDAGNEAVAR